MEPLASAAEPAALPPLGTVLRRHGLRARKRLGQHFLLDPAVCAKIAAAAGDLADRTVLEVGPGPGGLTRALLAAGAHHVVAVERDERFLPLLAELADAYPGRLTVLAGDALGIDEASVLAGAAAIVANLPFNIATALLLKWLPDATRYRSLTLMFQKEVVARLVAEPRTPAYGRLAVATRWRCTARRLFDVPAGAFVPPPRVTSSVVSLVPRAEPLAPADPALLERVVAAAFGGRRKMLRQSLKRLAPVDPLALLAVAGIAPERRAEELSVCEFCALARAFAVLSIGATSTRP
ncbi:MAG: 16S rRNA (adenine(1518)-N(6)/adenine(1519)-N(6))-dimethyltransferase RsmA [Alphaproteobacteria bacterium]|nr:16S rRNA (adenine(1518)-N(6)/adenine(1519)-N(6))-dimethyltransferase RsmA [Alphaproteobacteria bacterium]